MPMDQRILVTRLLASTRRLGLELQPWPYHSRPPAAPPYALTEPPPPSLPRSATNALVPPLHRRQSAMFHDVTFTIHAWDRHRMLWCLACRLQNALCLREELGPGEVRVTVPSCSHGERVQHSRHASPTKLRGCPQPCR